MKIKLLILMVLALTVTACEEPQVYSTDYVDKLEARITELEKLVGVTSPDNEPVWEVINDNFSAVADDIRRLERKYAPISHCHSTDYPLHPYLHNLEAC